ncbi:hypothetical protein SAMN05216212_0337 [Microbulbifer yueqingensis]|uniref:Uncharacterized protein n=1 Tax=Microbulbifer yueqingensis TaxID=658219 RepID=A0A1G8UZR7_9GAMM|nr:hypothetical protein SAMN05216212_0337 [Microbulbifer yueqingensis]
MQLVYIFPGVFSRLPPAARFSFSGRQPMPNYPVFFPRLVQSLRTLAAFTGGR